LNYFLPAAKPVDKQREGSKATLIKSTLIGDLLILLRKHHIKVRLFQNFSFGTTTLDLIEKAG
jgi:hypothetical protein